MNSFSLLSFKKLLEQDPYADGDDSFFFEQDYTSISAWLGEGTKPFLGIPTGPLQVGHTIGALVIVLMAFIEYPGFPLTNLPTPLRGALQGGTLIFESLCVFLDCVEMSIVLKFFDSQACFILMMLSFHRTGDDIRHQRSPLCCCFLQGAGARPIGTYLDRQNPNSWWTST